MTRWTALSSVWRWNKCVLFTITLTESILMKQKMSALQSRLELASIKQSGWNGMSMQPGDTYSPLSPTSATSFAHRRPSSSRLPPIRVEPYPTPQSPAQTDAARMPPPATSPIASGSRTRYEPPSPSRPWQLMDVLWQPLPPPSTAPTAAQAQLLSPRKRTRDDMHIKGHRRASSGNGMAMMQTKARLKDRSYSHSTTADVDAAKALAFMHRPSSSSLTVPTSPRNRRATTPDRRAPRSHSAKPRRLSKPQQEEEDRSAAELMMFLAHSPSPLHQPSDSPRASPSTARVLFTGGEERSRSNLAAPPITNTDFGGYL